MNNYYFGNEPLGRMADMDSDHSSMMPSELPNDMVVTMAYVPLQFYDNLFDINEGFHCGTIFPELSKPFLEGDPK